MVTQAINVQNIIILREKNSCKGVYNFESILMFKLYSLSSNNVKPLH